jgi:hypothetical protein
MSNFPHKVFWVGSVPAGSASEVVDLLYSKFPGNQLLTLPHGEESRLATWAIEALKRAQEEVAGHEVAIQGDSETYNALRRVKYVGNGLPGIKPEFWPAEREAAELREAIRQLQDKVGPEVILPPGHLGIIDPAAWAAFTYVPEEASTWLEAYRKAVVTAMNAACPKDGGLEPQLESPYALMSVLATPKDQRKEVAEARAQEIADTVMLLEAPVRIHLCYGDFGGKSWLSALGIPEIDLEPLVLLVNAIQEKCGDRVLSYLLPMASGDIKPSTEESFYAPLHDINPKARVVIGSVRPEVDADTNFKAISLAAGALRCEVLAISLPCGAGRLDDQKFQKVIEIFQECLRRSR